MGGKLHACGDGLVRSCWQHTPNTQRVNSGIIDQNFANRLNASVTNIILSQIDGSKAMVRVQGFCNLRGLFVVQLTETAKGNGGKGRGGGGEGRRAQYEKNMGLS